jgi:hypothetical protein
LPNPVGFKAILGWFFELEESLKEFSLKILFCGVDLELFVELAIFLEVSYSFREKPFELSIEGC